MIKDVTTNWKQPRAGGGLYILRGRNEPYRGVVRIGGGGIRNGKNGIFGRLKTHLGPWNRIREFGTHECQPFDLIRAWELDGWTTAELQNGEHCLYRAFAVRFQRRTEGLPDASLFLVPEGNDLVAVMEEVLADLEAIEGLR